MTACAGNAMDTLSADWTASDPNSSTDLYSYAIGTSPGGSKVVNWTNTSATAFSRFGLWSPIATPDAIYAGSRVCSSTSILVNLGLTVRQ